MSAKHTPGPWKVASMERDGAKMVWADPDERGIIQCVCDVYGPQREAHARMIAATPVLLAALKGLVKAVDNLESEEAGAGRNLFISPGCVVCTDGATPDKWNTGPCAYHVARAAIEKAEGGAK